MNEKCPDIVIEYYESRCPLNQKFNANINSDLIKSAAPLREKVTEPEDAETKTSSDMEIANEPVQETTEELPYLKESEKTDVENAASESDVVNAAFSINVDDANSVQVSYSLPLIENQPGEELMETQDEQSTQDTSNCHMPDIL